MSLRDWLQKVSLTVLAAGVLAESYGESNSFGFTFIDLSEEFAREERLFVS